MLQGRNTNHTILIAIVAIVKIDGTRAMTYSESICTQEVIAMDLREIEIKRIEKISELFLKAARAVPKDKQDWKPMPTGNSAQDIVTHLAMANHFFAGLLRGSAPKETKKANSYEEALKLFEDSKADLIGAIRSVDPAQFAEKRTMPWGEERTLKDLITSPMPHMAYHWGQIAYLQTLWGDTEDRF